MQTISSRRDTLEEILAFPEVVQRLARVAELRQDPSGGADRPGELEDDIPSPHPREPMLDQ